MLLDQDTQIRSAELYKEHGYVVIPNVIEKELIDNFNEVIKRNVYADEKSMIPQMDTQEFGSISLSDDGFLENPIADIHLIHLIQPHFKPTWKAALDIITHQSIVKFLNFLNHSSKQSLVMSMYFDKNTGTPPHQDGYYLDTLPVGNLTAAWIALEDIDERAGRFYVVPNSQHMNFDLTEEEIKVSDLYEKKVRNHIDDNTLEVKAPPLKAGDILFWNSGTIHGSLRTKEKGYSRKSFTCHFVPSNTKYIQNRYIQKVREIEGFEHNEVLCRITNSVNRENINFDLKSRSVESFDR